MHHIARQRRWCCLKWRSNGEDLRVTWSCICGGNIYKARKQDYKRLVIPKDQKVYLQHACHLREYLHNTRNQKNIIQRRESSHARRYSKALKNCKWAPEKRDLLSRTKILRLVAHRMPIQSQLKKTHTTRNKYLFPGFFSLDGKNERFPQVPTLPGHWEKGWYVWLTQQG